MAKSGHASGNARRVSLAPNLVTQNYTYDAYRSVITDSLGRHIDHDMNLERTTRSCTPLNGIRYFPNNPNYYRAYNNYNVHGSRGIDGHVDSGWPSIDDAATMIRARTNVSRPVVSVPTMIAEAKDFINPIKNAGLVALKKKKASQVLRRKGRIKESADAFLSYKFAIEPTIRDLATLLNLQDSINQRIGELDRLHSNGGLKRRMTVFTGVGVAHSSIAIESVLGIVFSNRIDRATDAHTWATINWKPIMGKTWKTDAEKVEVASRLVMGMNAHNLVQAAWELVPWSFMIDWFTNVGNVIAANNNTIPAHASHVNVMQHRRTSISWTRSDNEKDFSGGSAVFTRETKRRDAVFGSPLALRLPFLTGGQLSILGALSASRLSR